MHSVLEADKDTITDGKLLQDSISQGIGSFTPDLLFEKMVKNYKEARRILGESIIRELTGYDPDYVERNMPLPEFKKILKEAITKNIEKLKEKGLINKEGQVTDKGMRLSAAVLFVEELDKLILRGHGEHIERKKWEYGDKSDYAPYNRQRYRDIAIKQSIKTALRRGHTALAAEDLRVFERRKKGKITIIYAMDSSGSMKGEKLKTAKKAGIALAYKAMMEKNKVGLITFDSEIRAVIPPSTNFPPFLEEISRQRAGLETNIKKVVEKTLEVFPKTAETKHLILLTDALPTKGENPQEETLKAISQARNARITISIIGIKLDRKGEELAKKMIEVGQGRLYIAKDIQELDRIILTDYYTLTSS
ncbi:MAG: vWA domain-containing protein [Nanoarchaeota archaeon]